MLSALAPAAATLASDIWPASSTKSTSMAPATSLRGEQPGCAGDHVRPLGHSGHHQLVVAHHLDHRRGRGAVLLALLHHGQAHPRVIPA